MYTIQSSLWQSHLSQFSPITGSALRSVAVVCFGYRNRASICRDRRCSASGSPERSGPPAIAKFVASALVALHDFVRQLRLVLLMRAHARPAVLRLLIRLVIRHQIVKVICNERKMRKLSISNTSLLSLSSSLSSTLILYLII